MEAENPPWGALADADEFDVDENLAGGFWQAEPASASQASEAIRKFIAHRLPFRTLEFSANLVPNVENPETSDAPQGDCVCRPQR